MDRVDACNTTREGSQVQNKIHGKMHAESLTERRAVNNGGQY